MELIGTHNSGTGEPSQGFLSHLILPFAKCQSKAIHEQYFSGCRYFDLRVRWNDTDNSYYFAHGLWTSQTNLETALYELNGLTHSDEHATWISLTYEGSLDSVGQKVFAHNMTSILSAYKNINISYIAVKKPKWTTLWRNDHCPPNYQGFWSLDKWYRAILPFPWIWKKLFPQPTQQEGYRLVDFL